jgi:DUF1009 family protein
MTAKSDNVQEPVGLIAGGGQLPLLEARGIRAAGRPVVGLGLSGQYDPELPALCDRFDTCAVLRLGGWVRRLRRMGAVEAVMVGRVGKTLMYSPRQIALNLPDLTVAKMWFRTLRNDRRSQRLLDVLAETLEDRGVTLIDTTRYIPDHLATAGPMTQHRPGDAAKADIQFGLPVLRQMHDLDLGQAIAVKGRDVVAVEAIEGTNAMIRRAGRLARRSGWTLLKGATPGKDLRFDVPTVGLETIETLRQAGAVCMALAAGRVIMVDKPQVIAAADAARIAVVGVKV